MSSLDVTVAPVAGTSLAEAVDLLVRFFREEGFKTPAVEIERNLAAMLDDSACWVALATIAGNAVGIVTISTMRYVEQGRLGEIGDLYVMPPYRGRGIARRLIGEAMGWCRARGCAAVFVTVTPEGETRHRLSEFYEQFGFRSTGRTTWSAPL